MEMKVRSWARLHDVAWAEEAEEREKEGRVQGKAKEREGKGKGKEREGKGKGKKWKKIISMRVHMRVCTCISISL